MKASIRADVHRQSLPGGCQRCGSLKVEGQPINSGIGRARTVVGVREGPMLRRLNVRTRLVAVIAAPLVLLLAVAVPEVLERREPGRRGRPGRRGHHAPSTTSRRPPTRSRASAPSRRRVRAGAGAGCRAGARRAAGHRRPKPSTVPSPALARSGRASTPPSTRRRRPPSPARTALPGAYGDGHRRSEVPWKDPFASVARVAAGVSRRRPRRSPPTSAWGKGCPRSRSWRARRRPPRPRRGRWPRPRPGASCAPTRADKLTDLRADEAAYRAAYLTTSPTVVRDERRDELLTSEGTAAGRTVDQRHRRHRRWVTSRAGSTSATPVSRCSARSRPSGPPVPVWRPRWWRPRRPVRARATSCSRAAACCSPSCSPSPPPAPSPVPLRELTEAADHLAEERLPQLVDALRHPVDDDEHYLSAAMEPIAVRADDELGHLAQAFNAVQSVAVDVAAEQATPPQEGHQRAVREPGPAQPGAARPPDPAPRPARARGAGHRGARAPLPARPPRHPDASERREPARAGRRRVRTAPLASRSTSSTSCGPR